MSTPDPNKKEPGTSAAFVPMGDAELLARTKLLCAIDRNARRDPTDLAFEGAVPDAQAAWRRANARAVVDELDRRAATRATALNPKS